MPKVDLPANSLFRYPVSDLNPTLRVLDRYGVTTDHIDMLRVNDGDNDYTRRVCAMMVNGAFPSSTDMRIARVALGNHLWEPADWVRFFGALFSDEELDRALQFPLHEDVLMGPDPWEPKKLLKETHMAFWGVDKIGEANLTVAQMIAMHPDDGKMRYFYPTSWHDGQPHVHVVTLEPRWHVLRIEVVPGSWGKSPGEQLGLLPPEYEPPATVAEVAKDQFVFRKIGERPNRNRWARCAETTIKTKTCSVEFPSIVGLFNDFGLDVRYWYGGRHGHVGCGASLKLQALPA